MMHTTTPKKRIGGCTSSRVRYSNGTTTVMIIAANVRNWLKAASPKLNTNTPLASDTTAKNANTSALTRMHDQTGRQRCSTAPSVMKIRIISQNLMLTVPRTV
jgi:hypothetical protein